LFFADYEKWQFDKEKINSKDEQVVAQKL